MRVNGYITMKVTCKVEENAREIHVRYLVIDAPSSYNMCHGGKNHIFATIFYSLLRNRVNNDKTPK